MVPYSGTGVFRNRGSKMKADDDVGGYLEGGFECSAIVDQEIFLVLFA
jgi:hypothetical protein